MGMLDVTEERLATQRWLTAAIDRIQDRVDAAVNLVADEVEPAQELSVESLNALYTFRCGYLTGTVMGIAAELQVIQKILFVDAAKSAAAAGVFDDEDEDEDEEPGVVDESGDESNDDGEGGPDCG